MAPNNPAMIFPGCPVCGTPVRSTNLTEGDGYRLPGTPRSAPPDGAVPAGEYPPTGDAEVTPGAGPEQDVLSLYPCGCHLVGGRAHAFNLEALNITWPDLVIDVHVTVPGGVFDVPYPTTFANIGVVDGDELRELAAAKVPGGSIGALTAALAAARHGDPLDETPRQRVARLIRAAAEAVAASIEHPVDALAAVGPGGDPEALR